MRFFDRQLMRLTMLFTRRRAAAQLDRELEFHLDRQVQENIAAGMNRQDARAAALRTFGNLALLRDQARATWSWSTLESILRDLRIGVRTLLRAPGFTMIAIVVMALGIGANIALFTVVRGVLLSPLPYLQPQQLVTLYQDDSNGKHSDPYLPLDAGSFWEWQNAVKGSAELALISPFQEYDVSAEGGNLPEHLDAGWCSWNFFHVLGVQPALGRTFTADDDRPEAPATVILSDGFWKRRYSGDRSIVGKTIWLDARPYTVIGVLPPSFSYTGAFSGNKQSVWTPVRHDAPLPLLSMFGDHEFVAIGRLLHGTSLHALVNQLDALQHRIRAGRPESSVHDKASGRPMLDDAVDNYKTPLYALLAATGCVLLIACMNVAGLLVARAAARRRDQAIRAAMGGGRARLLRERLVESMLLSVAGGAVGLAMAWGALQWLVYARQDMNRVEAIRMDGSVALFTVALIALCAISSGLISMIGSGGKHILSVLQESSRTSSAGTARARLRKALLALQVGLTVVLLIGAGLLLKSFERLRSTDLGVPVDNVLTMFFSLPDARYKTELQDVQFFESLIARVRALPGVEAAGLASQVPGEGWGGDHLMNVVEHPSAKGQETDLMARGADPGYFAAIRMPLLRGRVFTSDERLDRAHVVLISQGAARQMFGEENPIGKHLRGEGDPETWEIIGVVGDTRWRIAAPPQPTMYWPIYGNGYSVARIVVRGNKDVESLAMPIQRILGSMDRDLAVSGVMTLREAVGKTTINSEFDSLLVLCFAVIALILAAAGLYGVLAYLVTQRTGEIGIRIALGSPRTRVLNAMLFDGLRPAVLGLVLGLVASGVVVRQIKSMLYQTEPLDPWVFAAVAGVLLIVAASACLLPAWRASRLNPMQALRTE
ncbi:MAG TPA: ABC transporter permease [Terracidiphilus sp.]|nr:ABC transporter permease [Terracidiphilus sp.]